MQRICLVRTVGWAFVVIAAIAVDPQPVLAVGRAVQQASTTSEHTATGYGASPQQAFDDALRQALRQAIGALVRSKVVVVDDAVAEERISSQSQGFIESATKLGGASQESGVYAQRVRVVVQRAKLIDALKGGGAPGGPRPSAPAVEASQIVEVAVVGQGTTPEAALDDAIRSALRQVARTLVRSDSVVDGDRIALDRILTHSGGFIERVEKSGNARLKDGQYEQAATIHVRRGKIATVMAQPASPAGEFDAVTLHARIQTLREQNASASEFMQVLFEDWPASVLRYEVSEAPHEASPPDSRTGGEIGIADDEVFLKVTVDVALDREKWNEWCKSASEVFSAIAVARATVSWSAKRAAEPRLPVADGPAWGTSDQFVRDLGPVVSSKTGSATHLFGLWAVDKLHDAAEAALAAATPAGGKGSLKAPLNAENGGLIFALSQSDAGKTDVFRIDRAFLKHFKVEITEAPLIEVSLLDLSGAEVDAREASRARRAEVGSGSVGVFLEGASWMAATPLRLVPLYGMFVFSPWMNTEVGQVPIFSERISLPFGFIVKRSEVAQLCKVRVGFGERAKCEFCYEVPQRLPKQ